jgi:chaperonin GroES
MTAKKKAVPAVQEEQEEQDPPATPAPAASYDFTPIGQHLIVRPIAEGERKVGSIVIPDTAKERPSMGIVVAVSIDARNASQGLLYEGQQVIYGKYSGHELTIDDQSYVILKAQDILTIIHERAK